MSQTLQGSQNHPVTYFQSLRLDGLVAAVTGAGQGIGAAIAHYLAEAGAELILIARNSAQLEAVAAEIAARGGVAHAQACDVTDSGALRQLIQGLPRLDILVNNAGTNIPEPMLEVSDEHLDLLIDVNMRSVFVASQAAARKMLEQPERKSLGASIINISSQMALIGSPNRTAYCMAKAGVEGLTRAMAIEFAPLNIRVNSVAPTITSTPLIERVLDTEEKRKFLYSQIPLGRPAVSQEIAAAVAYLASPAAAMVTGTCLKVDGGWTAQ
jgi:NAD(P)-dependent dehydrogenase (short-subunit alcohol dehydrogenase family)